MIRFLEHVDMWPTEAATVNEGTQMELPWPSTAVPGDVGLVISENAVEVFVLVGNETFSIMKEIVDTKCQRIA